MTLSSTLQEWLEDKKWSSLEEGRRPSIVYEEDMPVIVRRRGVTMTVRQSGGQDLKSISLLMIMEGKEGPSTDSYCLRT